MPLTSIESPCINTFRKAHIDKLYIYTQYRFSVKARVYPKLSDLRPSVSQTEGGAYIVSNTAGSLCCENFLWQLLVVAPSRLEVDSRCYSFEIRVGVAVFTIAVRC